MRGQRRDVAIERGVGRVDFHANSSPSSPLTPTVWSKSETANATAITPSAATPAMISMDVGGEHLL